MSQVLPEIASGQAPEVVTSKQNPSISPAGKPWICVEPIVMSSEVADVLSLSEPSKSTTFPPAVIHSKPAAATASMPPEISEANASSAITSIEINRTARRLISLGLPNNVVPTPNFPFYSPIAPEPRHRFLSGIPFFQSGRIIRINMGIYLPRDRFSTGKEGKEGKS